MSRVAGPLGGSKLLLLSETQPIDVLSSSESTSSPTKSRLLTAEWKSLSFIVQFCETPLCLATGGPIHARKALQMPPTRMKVLLPSTSSVEHLSYEQTSDPPLQNVFPLLALYPTRSMFSRKAYRGRLQGWLRRILSIVGSDPRTQPWVDPNNPRLLPA